MRRFEGASIQLCSEVHLAQHNQDQDSKDDYIDEQQ